MDRISRQRAKEQRDNQIVHDRLSTIYTKVTSLLDNCWDKLTPQETKDLAEFSVYLIQKLNGNRKEHGK